MRGKFLVFEGTDGSGKSTCREYAADWLRERGHEVVLTREPGGTPFAEILREITLEPRDETVHANTETLLFFAARQQHLQGVIIPALERGAIVLCDRFIASTYAYQAAAGKGDLELIKYLDKKIVGDNQPDLTFYLQIDAKTALDRATARGKRDRIEAKGPKYLERANAKYQELARTNPNTYETIDATLPLAFVLKQLDRGLIQIHESMAF